MSRVFHSLVCMGVCSGCRQAPTIANTLYYHHCRCCIRAFFLPKIHAASYTKRALCVGPLPNTQPTLCPQEACVYNLTTIAVTPWRKMYCTLASASASTAAILQLCATSGRLMATPTPPGSAWNGMIHRVAGMMGHWTDVDTFPACSTTRISNLHPSSRWLGSWQVIPLASP